MLKNELKEFSFFLSENACGTASAPLSLSGLSRACATDLALEAPAEKKQRMRQKLCLRTSIVIPDSMRGFRGRALVLHGLCGHCIVLLDGKKVGEWRSPPSTVSISLPDAQGPISLELQFPERAVPMDVGLLGNAELVAYSHDLITEVSTEQIHKGDKCELAVHVRTLRGGEFEAFATLYSPSGEMHYLGLVRGEGRIALPSVQRYRPAGTGVVGLYRLVVTLYHDGHPTDSHETLIGLRKLAFAKEGGTRAFEVLLDNAPYFIKAARTCAYPVLHAEKNIALFERALRAFVRAGGNTLFATCENGFLSEHTYALCDRFGLLVFQQLPSPAEEQEMNDYFAELKASLSVLLNHPSLALLLLPEGVNAASELGRSIKSFFALAFPSVQVCAAPLRGFIDTSAVCSMPSSLAVRRNLPMEARHIFSYAMESAQDTPGQLVSMLSAASETLPYGASLEDVCYITAIASADAAQNALADELKNGIPGGFLIGDLFEGEISMKPSLMDCILSKKTLCFDFWKMFSPIFLNVQGTAQGATLTLATAGAESVAVRMVTSLMDRSNNCICRVMDDCVVEPGAPLILKKPLADIPGHEREYYILVSVYEKDMLLCEQTALFVPAKHFRFAYPDVHFEIKGSGRQYEIALSASAYTRRLHLSFAKTSASFEKNDFDVTSDTKIFISVETDEVTTSRHLEAQLRLRSLYDVGRITERDLADETDFETT